MAKFIELTLLADGHNWDAIVNVEDIAHFSEGANNLTLHTPFPNGRRTVTVKSTHVERLVQALLDIN